MDPSTTSQAHEAVQQFLTSGALLTFGGASIGVYVLTNTVRVLLKRSHPVIPFLFAALIVFGGAWSTSNLSTIVDGILALINTCLLFTSAAGIHESTSTRPTPPPSNAAGFQPHGAPQ